MSPLLERLRDVLAPTYEVERELASGGRLPRPGPYAFRLKWEVRSVLSMYRGFGTVTASAALLLLAGTEATAQASGSADLGGGIDFTASWLNVDLAGLNDRLLAEGIPTFDEQFLALGFSVYLEFGRWLVGAEGQWLLEGDQLTSEYKYSVSGDFGLINVGYAFQLGDLRLYPLTGVGGGRMNYKAVERQTPTFDEILDDPGRSSDLSQLYFLWQVALGMDYLIRLSKDTGARSGVSVGAQFGYMLPFGHQDWKLNGSDVSGGPAFGVDGGYVMITIGWSSRRGQSQ
jgi:hypothetical protein